MLRACYEKIRTTPYITKHHCPRRHEHDFAFRRITRINSWRFSGKFHQLHGKRHGRRLCTDRAIPDRSQLSFRSPNSIFYVQSGISEMGLDWKCATRDFVDQANSAAQYVSYECVVSQRRERWFRVAKLWHFSSFVIGRNYRDYKRCTLL